MGNLKSVSEFLHRTYEEHFEFRVRRSHKYWGASSCRDLKTIILDSLTMSCSMPRGGGTCENFDRDARVIFLGLKFTKTSFFWVSLSCRHFFGVEKIAVIFWVH